MTHIFAKEPWVMIAALRDAQLNLVGADVQPPEY